MSQLARAITYVIIVRWLLIASVSPQSQIDSRQHGTLARYPRVPIISIKTRRFNFDYIIVALLFKWITDVLTLADRVEP